MLKMRILIVLFAAVLVPTAALAKQEYAAYEGADAIRTGAGGSRISKNGIDYWTTGTPPLRYQILGILTDARKNRLLDGNVIGSKSVAKIVKSAGGDAVIVAGSETKDWGTIGTTNGFVSGSTYSGNFNAISITRTTTQLVVLKYLD